MMICFIGPRKIRFTEKLWDRVKNEIENIIINDGVDTFLFGSRYGEFEYMCHEAVTELKFKYKFLNRICLRSVNEYANLIPRKLEPLFFELIIDHELDERGKKYMIKLNEVLIDRSDVLVGYLNKSSVLFKKPFSVVQHAVDYANKNCKRIINIF